MPARSDGRLQSGRCHHVEQVYRQLAQDCVDRMGFSFLANIGTASVARDMDIVRQALGDDQINYLGYNHGTGLGTAYLDSVLMCGR